jgi:hypothetical protein
MEFLIIYLTLKARNIGLRKQPVEKLNKEGSKPNFHQLEIDKNDSVVAFANYLKQKYDEREREK